MLLARQVARSKWDRERGVGYGLAASEIAADALTGDLRTHGNKLSFWQCRSDGKEDVEDVALAIAAAGERLNTFDIAWIDGDLLRSDGQTLEVSKGCTPVSDLADQHVDVAKLDAVRLTLIAERVATAIGDGQIRRLRKAELKSLLADALAGGRMAKGQLAGTLRTEL